MPIARSKAKLTTRKVMASVTMMRNSRAVVDSSGIIMEFGPVNLNPGNIKKCGNFVWELMANVTSGRNACDFVTQRHKEAARRGCYC